VKHSRRMFSHLAVRAVALPLLPRMAWSLDYPTRPVRVLVGFQAGSGPDVIARLVGQRLSERLGRQFIIDNRSGAGSSLAAQDVVAAPADGYALLLAANANAVNASLYPNLPFNFVRDIAADMRGELDRVQEQMAELTREHQRAQALKQIFGTDPLTRDRFNHLHANIDQYPGKMAELQEEERLLTRWLDRCRDLLERKAA